MRTGQKVEIPDLKPVAWVKLLDGSIQHLYKLQPRQYQAYCLTPLAKPLDADYPRHIAYGGAAGGGKAGYLNDCVVTPYGLRPYKELEVGQKVCHPSGTTTTIIAVQDWGEVPFYRVTFQDGTSARVSEGHLWTCWKARRGDGQRRRVYTTEQLKEHVEEGYYEMLVPITEPVQFTKGYRPDWDVRETDAYTLGVLLGDGSLTGKTPGFVSEDQEIVSRVAESYDVSDLPSRENRYTLPGSSIMGHLRRYDLTVRAEFKHIPEPYLYASLEDRWSLAQGLFDTDGTVDERGHVSFCTVSSELAQNVAFLVRSLGFRATVSEAQEAGYRDDDGEYIRCQDRYRIYVQGHGKDRLFGLERKKERAKIDPRAEAIGNRVESVEYIGEMPGRCITVDAPDGLYIHEDSFTVTHNSYLARAVVTAAALKWPGINALILRRTLDEVKQNHIKPYTTEEVPKKLPDGRRLYSWNGSDLCATFANGSAIYFGYLKDSKDRERYSGNEYDIVVFEESTHYAWQDVRWLSGNRNRATTDLSRPFCLYPSNPGRQGHHWYKRLFIDCRYDPSLNEDPADYAFIQAKVEHNFVLRRRDPRYVNQLDTLPEPLRSWLRDGDFDAGLGLALTMIEKDRHLIEPFNVPASWLKFGAFDWGYAHPFSFGIYAVNEDGRMYKIDTMTGRHLQPKQIARAVKSRLYKWGLLPPGGGEGDRLDYIVTGKDAFDRHRSRDDTTQTIAEAFLEEGVILQKGNQDRIHGLNVMRAWLSWHQMGPSGEDIQPPLRFFDTPGNRKCIDQLASMPVDEDNPEDALKRDADQFGQGGDDMYDETRLACASRPRPKPSEWSEREFDGWSDDALAAEAREQRKSKPPKSMRTEGRPTPEVVHPEFGTVY